VPHKGGKGGGTGRTGLGGRGEKDKGSTQTGPKKNRGSGQYKKSKGGLWEDRLSEDRLETTTKEEKGLNRGPWEAQTGGA